MAQKSFSTVNQLQREIMRRANEALKNEVKDYVEDKMKSHVEKDVYATYSPVEYERREANGGLLDDSNIKDVVHDRTLTVYNETHVEGPRLNHKEYKNPDGLPRLLESDNIRNPWTHKRYRWMSPRPFMTNTQKDINYRYADIVEMLRKRINHDTTK